LFNRTGINHAFYGKPQLVPGAALHLCRGPRGGPEIVKRKSDQNSPMFGKTAEKKNFFFGKRHSSESLEKMNLANSFGVHSRAASFLRDQNMASLK
jgi:hypothetical protein